jgi:glycerate 2-kinase
VTPGQKIRETARRIFLRTLDEIDVRRVMLRRLRQDDSGSRLLFAGSGTESPDGAVSLAHAPVVIAIGKAAAAMAQAMSEILGGPGERRITSGLIVAPVIPDQRLDRFRYVRGGHPYPTEGSLEGAQAALELVSGLNREDLVIFLISGGGSALFERPLDPAVRLDDLVAFNKLLVTCGLPIEKINVLRKHVSAVKGGRLAVRAHPAAQLTLFISDVPEDLDSMVASGPTFPDSSTANECYSLAESAGLVAQLPESIRRRFEQRDIEETPKPGDARFSRSRYCRLLSNRDAVEAARHAAQDAGFAAEIDQGEWDMDFRGAARAQSAALDALASKHAGRPVCLVAGGEVISPVTGAGTGGRNQAFALYAAGLIAGRNRTVLSAGTDGRDGNSPASGAVADGSTMERAKRLGLDPRRALAESDAYPLFKALDDALETGYTGNNVRDVRVWLAS